MPASKPDGGAARRRASRSDPRAEALRGTVEALRVLDLATTRFRTMTAQQWQITVTDSMILSNLAMVGGEMTPGELGRRLMISSGTLTSMLDRLEHAGMIARAPHPTDRRSLLIMLTDKGRESLFYNGERLREAVDAVLPDDASSTYVQIMHAIAAAMDAITDEMLAHEE